MQSVLVEQYKPGLAGVPWKKAEDELMNDLTDNPSIGKPVVLQFYRAFAKSAHENPSFTERRQDKG